MKVFFSFLMLIMASGLSAQVIYGSGNVTESYRKFEGIKSIEIKGHIIVELVYGEEEGVKIIMDDNLHDYLKTDFSKGVLKVWVEKNRYRKVKSRKVIITANNLESLSNNGSGDITGKGRFSGTGLNVKLNGSGDVDLNLSYTTIDVNLSGSGEISLLGNCNKLQVTQFGSGDVKAYNLQVLEVDVNATGSGNIQVFCNGPITGRISGSGDLQYRGSATPNVTASGSGAVVKEN